MPAGDAGRTWFPEMIDLLRTEWNSEMSFNDLIAFRERLDAILQRLRSERNVTPPMMWCPVCQARRKCAAPRVSVRAMILSLRRFGIASAEETKQDVS